MAIWTRHVQQQPSGAVNVTGVTETGNSPGFEPPPFDVFEAMRRRRMHREFLDKAVEGSVLERLVYAAGRASSARAGIRHLVIVTDGAIMKTIRQVCPGFLNNAPAAIAVCTDTVWAEELLGPSADKATVMDSGGAAAYLSIAAPALGLGICYVTSWPVEVVQGTLGLPAHIRPDILIAIGYPVARPMKAPRRFQPIVHRGCFGAEEGVPT
jgi:nitroreductase